MKAEDICAAAVRLEGSRKNIDQIWDLIERFVVPFQGRFFRNIKTESEVNWRKREIYDSTAVDANITLASSMQGNIIPEHMQWFNTRFRQSGLNEDKEAASWLDTTSKEVFYLLQDSNFYLEAGEVMHALPSFGTAPIVQEYDKDNKEYIFTAIPPKECYFELDWRGHCRRFYRVFEWTALQIKSKFGAGNYPARLDEVIKTSPERRFTIIFAIYVREQYKDADTSVLIAPQFRPVGYKYIMKDDKTELGEEGGYYDMPVSIPRWRRNIDSKHGYSPAMVCLSDILSVNEYVETDLEARAKAVDPANLVQQRGLISDLDLQRGGLTVLRDINQIKPYESGTKFDVSEAGIARLQNQIRRIFFVDQLELKESPAMTATEVNVRYELMQRLLGPTLGRIKNDWLDHSLQRTFNIAIREGLVDPPPQVVLDEGAALDIEYLGPLPKAQRSGQADSIVRWLSDVAQLSNIYPEAKDIPDIDTAIRELGDLRGVPPKAINDIAKITAVRNQRNQITKQREGVEEVKQVGEAAEAMGKGADGMRLLQGGGDEGQ